MIPALALFVFIMTVSFILFGIVAIRIAIREARAEAKAKSATRR